jgi:hypothetical protein
MTATPGLPARQRLRHFLLFMGFDWATWGDGLMILIMT